MIHVIFRHRGQSYNMMFLMEEQHFAIEMCAKYRGQVYLPGQRVK